jgi:hypothetical protein
MTAIPTVSGTKLSTTLQGACPAVAVVHLSDAGGSAMGTIMIDVHRDDTNNALADIVVAALGGADVAAMRLRAAQQDADDATARVKRMADDLRTAENRLRRTLTGQSCVHGEVWVDVADDGAAWLHDPVKGFGGFGLRWPSLAALWLAHPELRPVRWADGRLICAAMAMPEQS